MCRQTSHTHEVIFQKLNSYSLSKIHVGLLPQNISVAGWRLMGGV